MKTLIGLACCITSIILLQKNQLLIGLPAFIIGIILMYGGNWPRKDR